MLHKMWYMKYGYLTFIRGYDEDSLFLTTDYRNNNDGFRTQSKVTGIFCFQSYQASFNLTSQIYKYVPNQKIKKNKACSNDFSPGMFSE
jgi:hypothetical protein